MRGELRVYIGKEKERVHLGDLQVNGRIIFKLILEKQVELDSSG